MKRILATGIATLDIINTLDGYPCEDAEVRAVAQRICRGGNATNTLVVLSQLGHCCRWAGVLVDEPDGGHIEAELQRFAIDCSAVRRLSKGKVPTSYICHNQHNGSRTIVHYRDLPEYDASSFARIDLSELDWLHFEGRNVAQTRLMLQHVRRSQPRLPISLEVEKPRAEIESLFGYAQLLLFSRPFAEHLGFCDAATFADDAVALARGNDELQLGGGRCLGDDITRSRVA